MGPIRILLADDHTIARDGLRALLDPLPPFCRPSFPSGADNGQNQNQRHRGGVDMAQMNGRSKKQTDHARR